MKQTTFEPLPASFLFAVGDVFTFIFDSHSVTWEITEVREFDLRFDHPSDPRMAGSMLIGKSSLTQALDEDRARRVCAANSVMNKPSSPKQSP